MVILYFLFKFLLVLYRYISMKGQGGGRNTRQWNGIFKLGEECKEIRCCSSRLKLVLESEPPGLHWLKDMVPKIHVVWTLGISQFVLPSSSSMYEDYLAKAVSLLASETEKNARIDQDHSKLCFSWWPRAWAQEPYCLGVSSGLSMFWPWVLAHQCPHPSSMKWEQQ